MEGKPNQAEQHPTEPLAADETTIALAWQEQVAQAQSSTKLAAELRHTRAALYRRFVAAYRDLLALSRARRRKLLRSMGMTLAGAALAFALALGQVPIARAASITVDGSCTLIDAITAANTDTAVGACAAGSGADTITLSVDVTLTSINNGHYYYNTRNGLPIVTSAITIEGAGHTIARDAGAPDFRILEASSSSALTLNDTTISGGLLISSSAGAGIYNYGTLTLNNSTLSGNSASNEGGGILNAGTLTLERSLVSGNSASGGLEIYNSATVVSANYNVFGHSGESNAQAFGGFTPSGSDISATSDGTTPTALAAILDTTLANNGGDTLTHALVDCSPAFDAAPSGPATDQRGVSRPQGADFDIGAFELEATAICNTAPVATNDSYNTNEDTALNVPAPGVLGNDTDADLDPLTAILVSGPANGSLTLNPNGSFTYTPNANFSGSDSFTYKANDGTADSNVATVSLTVVSALDQIDGLIGDVQALIDSGTINGGQGNALITKLENAAGYVEGGQTAQAINKLQAFINQVNSFISNGVLTSAEGQPLIDAANAVIQSLGG